MKMGLLMKKCESHSTKIGRGPLMEGGAEEVGVGRRRG